MCVVSSASLLRVDLHRLLRASSSSLELFSSFIISFGPWTGVGPGARLWPAMKSMDLCEDVSFWHGQLVS